MIGETVNTPSTLLARESLLLVVDIDDLLAELVESLDREVELLLVLRYRLTVLGALATGDQGASIVTGVREVELAHEALRLEELARSAATVLVTDYFELDDQIRLDELATHVAPGWGDLLRERRLALIESINGVQRLAETVHHAMGRRAALAEEALSFLRSDGASTYGRPVPRGGVLVDGVL